MGDDQGRVIMAINDDRLNEFLGRFVADLGATSRPATS